MAYHQPHTISTAATLSEALDIIQSATCINQIIKRNSASWVTADDQQDAKAEFLEGIWTKIHDGRQSEAEFLAFFNKGQAFLYWTVRLFQNQLLSASSKFKRNYKRKATDQINDELAKDAEEVKVDLDPMDLLDPKFIHHVLHSDQAVKAKITSAHAEIYIKGYLTLVYDQTARSKFPTSAKVAAFLGKSRPSVDRALRLCRQFLRSYYQSIQSNE